MASIKIELPFIPASLNDLLKLNRFVRAKYTKNRKEEVAWRCKQIYEKINKWPVDVNILIISAKGRDNRHHKKDSPNYTAKAEIDGLVLGGLLPDDNTDYVRRVTFEVQYGQEDKTIIELSTVQ